eukprot:Tbor_TRINITY_DN5993_c1_g1::TRINITY_DN5993_c1_g1_i1::g.18278::m.18278/K14404/CPSF4, YTH1; cleavage and polyadenylation specificity factor subunit 4
MSLLDDAADITFSFEDSLPIEEATGTTSSFLSLSQKTNNNNIKSKIICQPYQTGSCPNGEACPDRHVITDFKSVQLIVCRHWLRGACVNNNNCTHLHEYIEELIPECVFYSQFGDCNNPECVFRHVNPNNKKPRCAAYERGFCPLGPSCSCLHFKQRGLVALINRNNNNNNNKNDEKSEKNEVMGGDENNSNNNNNTEIDNNNNNNNTE